MLSALPGRAASARLTCGSPSLPGSARGNSAAAPAASTAAKSALCACAGGAPGANAASASAGVMIGARNSLLSRM